MDTSTPQVRSTAHVSLPVHTLEGAGFPVRRPFPIPEQPLLDPFLMVDQVGPIDLAPGEAKGAPPHPHRGFETIAYVLDGDIEYADSQGHRGVVPPGAVQWLTAGSGIVHSAMPTREFLARGGRQHNLQIWVNLPAALKSLPPRTRTRSAEEIPAVRTADGSELKVIAGRTHGVSGPFDTHVPVLVVHARLAAGGRAEFPAPAGHNAAVYVLAGEAALPDAHLPDGRLAVLAGDGERIVVTAPRGPAEVLVLTGEPIGESVARSGPFVMNTTDELLQAQRDHALGLMGDLTP
ncbi:pirin family protein [Kitasatospora sp. NPDC050543]|uniref:pirin family protein n=1 Tax=Kitasatospora sp. NPDC050543 TaxID=3364054 RepID=UPI00379832B8